MSAPSENMPIVVAAPRAKPLLLRHLPYFIGAAILVTLAATMQFDGYIHNILMQADDIRDRGVRSLGRARPVRADQSGASGIFRFGRLCRRYWNIGLPYQLLAVPCGRMRHRAAWPARLLGMSTLRLGGHYLAMVTISFQQIVTLVMINTIWLTHGPDGVSNIGRPALFQSAAIVSGFLRRHAGAGWLCRLAFVGYAARARHARSAR